MYQRGRKRNGSKTAKQKGNREKKKKTQLTTPEYNGLNKFRVLCIW